MHLQYAIGRLIGTLEFGAVAGLTINDDGWYKLYAQDATMTAVNGIFNQCCLQLHQGDTRQKT